MKLIDKDAAIAEIEKLKESYGKCPTRCEYEDGLKYGRMLGYIDSIKKLEALETKEVDEIPVTIEENNYGNLFVSTWAGLS